MLQVLTNSAISLNLSFQLDHIIPLVKMTSNTNMLRLFIVIILSMILSTHGSICRGCLELDDLTFDKVLAKFSIVLVKFDIAYPYGYKHDEYTKLAIEIGQSKSFDAVVAVVGIKNYGETIYNELVDRFNIGDQLPVIKLFNRHDKEPIDYPKDLNVTVDNLRQFLRRNSNLKIVLQDCLDEYDAYAKEFMDIIKNSSTPSTEINAYLDDIQQKVTLLESTKMKKIAQIYILYMQRIAMKNVEFIETEKLRLRQLLNQKISEQKKIEINQKLNILSAFDVKISQVSHTEL